MMALVTVESPGLTMAGRLAIGTGLVLLVFKMIRGLLPSKTSKAPDSYGREQRSGSATFRLEHASDF